MLIGSQEVRHVQCYFTFVLLITISIMGASAGKSFKGCTEHMDTQ